MRSECRGVVGRSRHHDLDVTFRVVVIVPGGTEPDNGVVQGDADSSAHGDDHSFAFEDRLPCLEMADDVPGNQGDPLIRPDDGLQLCPLALELLFLLDLLPLNCTLPKPTPVP